MTLEKPPFLSGRMQQILKDLERITDGMQACESAACNDNGSDFLTRAP